MIKIPMPTRRKLTDMWQKKANPPSKKARVETNNKDPKESICETQKDIHFIWLWESDENKNEVKVEIQSNAPSLGDIWGKADETKKSILKNVHLIKKNYRKDYDKYHWQITVNVHRCHRNIDADYFFRPGKKRKKNAVDTLNESWLPIVFENIFQT